MEWKSLISEVVWLWLSLLALLVLCASLWSLEMKRKNKIIFSVICVLILLFYPFGKRMEARKLIYDEGYSVIVADGFRSYKEIEKKKGLTSYHTFRPIAYRVNHENKLIYINHFYRTSFWPTSIDQIEFMDRE